MENQTNTKPQIHTHNHFHNKLYNKLPSQYKLITLKNLKHKHYINIIIALTLSGCSQLHKDLDKKEINRNDYYDLISSKCDEEEKDSKQKLNNTNQKEKIENQNLYDLFLQDAQMNQVSNFNIHNCIDDGIKKPSDKQLHKNFSKKINVAFSDSTSLKDALAQITTQAEISIIYNVNEDKKITFSCINKPVIDIIHDIAKTCDLRYIINDNSVTIQDNNNYFKIYDIQYLNITRESNNSIAIATDIFNNNDGASNKIDNGSQSVITNNSKSDYWSELKDSLEVITKKREGAFSINKQAGIITVFANQEEHKLIQQYINYIKYLSQNQVVIEAKILEIKLNDEFKNGIDWGFFNRLVNRNMFNNNTVSFVDETKDLIGAGSFQVANDKSSVFLLNTTNFNLISNFMERFGSVKTLSSPRITVLNNHSAIFKVAKNEVIYYPEIQKHNPSTTDTRATETFSANIKTIPIGIVMSVHPVIDKENGDIILHIRPTISRSDNNKSIPVGHYAQATDPALLQNLLLEAQQNEQQQNKSTKIAQIINALQQKQCTTTQEIPVIEVREMDSILKIKPNQTIVMGGLMQEKTISNVNGILGLDKNIIGDITNKKNKTTELTELIIFIRVKLITPETAYCNVDKKIYKKYANDARPLFT